MKTSVIEKIRYYYDMLVIIGFIWFSILAIYKWRDIQYSIPGFLVLMFLLSFSSRWNIIGTWIGIAFAFFCRTMYRFNDWFEFFTNLMLPTAMIGSFVFWSLLHLSLSGIISSIKKGKDMKFMDYFKILLGIAYIVFFVFLTQRIFNY